jgi:hypothetical protein
MRVTVQQKQKGDEGTGAFASRNPQCSSNSTHTHTHTPMAMYIQTPNSNYNIFLQHHKQNQVNTKAKSTRRAFATALHGVSSVGLCRFVSSVPFPFLCSLFFSPPPSDQPRDQPGRCLYCTHACWMYLQSHFRLRNRSLVYVLCAYTRHLTMALV